MQNSATHLEKAKSWGFAESSEQQVNTQVNTAGNFSAAVVDDDDKYDDEAVT